MTSLPVFLLARLDEDEAAAKAATPGPWGTTWDNQVVAAYGSDADGDQLADGFDDVANTTHMARHDPARVLADVEAKRRIVEDATNQHTSGPELDWVMQVLALPYADHPDYREEWKPADVVFP